MPDKPSNMIPEDAIRELRAEVMALQTVLIGLMRTIRSETPQGMAVTQRAFRYAEYVTDLTSGQVDTPEAASYVTRTAELIEQLRSSIFDDENTPRHGI